MRMQSCCATDDNRSVRKNAAETEALSADEIKVVADWLAAGAKFDGDDPDKGWPLWFLPVTIRPPSLPCPAAGDSCCLFPGG